MTGFFKDIIKISGSNTSAAIVNIIIGILITRLLGPEGRGIYEAILVIPLIVISFSELGFRRSTIFHLGQKKFTVEEILSSLFITIVVTTIVGILICSFSFFFLNNPAFTIPLIILAVSRIPLRLVRIYTEGFFMGQEKYNLSILVKWIFLITNLASLIILIWIFEFGVIGALVSFLIANLLASLIAIIKIGSENKIRFRLYPKVLGSLIKFGLIYSAALFVMLLNMKVDILILGSLSTMEQVGFYSLAVAIVSNWQIPFNFSGIIVSKSANTTDKEVLNLNLAKLIRVSVLLALIAYIILYFIAPYLVEFVYGKDFLPSVQMIRVLIPGLFMLIMARIMGNRISGEGKPYIFMMIGIPALILNIILNFLWIPIYQGMGAAMATVVSYSFLTIVGLFVYSKYSGMPIAKIFTYRRDDFSFIKDLIQKALKRKNNQ